jgi:hypothetical protein
MLTFMPAGIMHMFKRKPESLILLIGRTAPGKQKSMVMRQDFRAAVVRDAGNESKRSNCREPQRAQQHTIAYTLF